jgi:tetratricopeptide (TPR) repeat protein
MMDNAETIARCRRAIVADPADAAAWRELSFAYEPSEVPRDPVRAALSTAAAKRTCQIGRQAGDLSNYAIFYCRRNWAEGLSYYTPTEIANHLTAVAILKSALVVDPHRTRTYYVLGTFLKNIGDIDGAERVLLQGLRLAPDDDGIKSILPYLLMLGRDFRRGLTLFEGRLSHIRNRLQGPAPLVWDGSPVENGTLLIAEEGGFGDTLQMIRYVPLIARHSPRIDIVCNKKLAALLSHLRTGGSVRINPQDWPNAARVSTFLSLPYILGTDLHNIPADTPYLDADPVRVAAWRDRLAAIPGFRVGISWYTPTDPTRRFPLSSFNPVAAIPGVSLISLQMGPALAEAATVDWPLTTFPDMDAGDDAFVDTAAVIQNLDLVITNDTSITHLAGALGKPAWVCVGTSPDWRWGERGDTSPWYPDVRVFRSRQLWRWEELFEEVAQRLRDVVAAAG